MKHYNPVILLLSFILVLVSCSNENKEHTYVPLTDIDFGEGVYRPSPFPFLDGIPPFSWLKNPDVVTKKTELEIWFNEDAVRSGSTCKIMFVDSNGNKINGLKIGESKSDNYIIKATTQHQIVPVSITIDPIVGDSLLKGSVLFLGEEIDQLNDIKFTSSFTSVGTWRLSHKIGINWVYWLSLIALVTIVLCVCYLLRNLIFSVGKYSINKILGLFRRGIGGNRHKEKSNKIKQKYRTKKIKRQRDRNPFIEKCERILLLDTASVSDKAMTLERLVTYWNYDLPEEDKDFEAELLDGKVMNAMKALENNYYRYTKQGMSWTGAELDSVLIPDKNVVPPNKNYSNMDGLR